MTAKQKAARETFKKVVAEAGKLRKKDAKLTQAQAVKKAWAMHKKVGAIKIIEKGETKSAKAKATYQQVRTKKGTFKGLKKIAGVRSITLQKARDIASSWHGGMFSALYQFASSGIIVKENYSRYLNEIESDLKNASTQKDKKDLQQLMNFITSQYDRMYTGKKFGSKVGAASSKVKAKKRKSNEMHTDTKSHNVNIRVVSGLPSYKDPDMARELELYADNDSLLYFQRRKPILINLSKKYKKGTFDVQKAAKLWRYYIDAALEKYNKEFGSRGDKWYDLMSVADRNLLALEYAQNTKEEFDLGNFTEK